MATYDEHWALERAIAAAVSSPCAKSKRGVVIWRRQFPHFVTGNNHQPLSFCTGDNHCREHCGQLCIHAEMAALLAVPQSRVTHLVGTELLHVKVVNGQAVESGPPRCWQCSRHLVNRGIKRIWLLEEGGWRSYQPAQFHELTLQNCNLASPRD